MCQAERVAQPLIDPLPLFLILFEIHFPFWETETNISIVLPVFSGRPREHQGTRAGRRGNRAEPVLHKLPPIVFPLGV